MEITETQTAINAGMAMANPFEINGTPAVMVPPGANLVLKPDLMDAPLRIERTITLHTVESFIDYYNRFATSASVVFCDMVNAKFTAILDYHDAMKPDWCKHTINYCCPKSNEWTRWIEKNEQWMTQVDFAMFIEQNINDVVEPAGAEMLEIATTLEANNAVVFRQGIRLDNGQHQIMYQENIEGKAGDRGQFRIPQKIKLGVRLFQGGQAYAVSAAFRYRIKDGALAMRYDLMQPHVIHEDAVMGIYRTIGERIMGGILLRGVGG